MPIEQISIGVAKLTTAGTIYSVPPIATFLIWWSLIGADLQTSFDGVNFATIDTVTANQVGKSITTHGVLIRTSADAWVILRK